MSTIVLAKGARGEVVRQLQSGLVAREVPLELVDGIYGNDTEAAVQVFQQLRGLPITGEVDIVTWREVLGFDPPAAGDRCLQLTAAFEGHGFSAAHGNWDGAGLTWGIIGYTLKYGWIQKIVLNVNRDHPELVAEAFGSNANKLLRMMTAPRSQAVEWADSISIGANKTGLAKPWRDAFARFGDFAEVREEQCRIALGEFLQPAERTASEQRLATLLGLALCFDIQVQNGGIKARARQAIDAELAANPVSTERERRVLIANAVADASSAKFREDVRTRKLTVATGAGKVHGRTYVLRNWGLSECPF